MIVITIRLRLTKLVDYLKLILSFISMSMGITVWLTITITIRLL